MPVTALTPVALGHNKALDVSVGVTADTVNFNGAPNGGAAVLIVTTGATPGTVAVSFGRSIDGVTPADVNVLDTGGAALAANKTYVVGLGNPADYGNVVTVKASQATTKFTVVNVAP